jgi:cellulose synthase/poly-beta-1,6-N-acetylglucosamine synthase-like glycosyltransferase
LTILTGLFLGLIFIQLLYWITFYIALSKSERVGTACSVPVSVIVCAHDEEHNLRELLPLLLKQNHEVFEIVIVNDRSNDGTYDYLLTETKLHPHLKMVHVASKPEHINGKKFALTLGIKAAQFDWVLLTDADCRPAPQWVNGMATMFTDDTDVVLGYSPYATRAGFLNAFIRYETMLTAIQYGSATLLRLPYMGVGRNLAYRKKIFLEHKGFSKHLSVMGGDDDLFVNQVAKSHRTVICFSPQTTTVSKPKESWRAYWQQKIRHLAVGKYYTVQTKIMLAPFTATTTLFWPLAGLVLTTHYPIAIGAMGARWLMQILVFIRFGAKTGDGQKPWKLPFLDFIFGFYYLAAGFKALFTKRVKWKT